MESSHHTCTCGGLDAEERPFEKPKESSVAGSSAVFQSLARTFARDGDEQRLAARKLLLRAGVWLPVETYQAWPVLMPWVVRDNSLAQSKSKATQSGLDVIKTASPTTGLLRTTNAPIGGLKTGLPVKWAGSLQETFKSKPLRVGPHEWMQSHCWSHVGSTGHSAATHPLTNSFVPNLVWLPHAIGRLTDDQRLIFGEEIRAIAWARYRHAPVAPVLQDVVENAWSLLDVPLASPVNERDLVMVNEFVPSAMFYRPHVRGVLRIWALLNALESNEDVSAVDVAPAVYKQSLASAPAATRAALRQHLQPFALAAAHFLTPANPDQPGKVTVKPATRAAKVPPPRFRITTSAATLGPLGLRWAALRLVQAVSEAGVGVVALKGVLKSDLREVPGTLVGEQLWERMASLGVPGDRDKWFVEEPIHADGSTWVLKNNSWDQARAQAAFPALAALADGKVAIDAVETPH
ncbi:hypothetical protein M3697_07040 [Janibacter melonis]|uniref:hypothetical protein n=1 Tax=Janibacter melonis TaxID=262209 RepID=UPI002044AD43|nr:hypothetical protein [Janibacter melonis]MCM3554860.1 hypothetical protein [Janibacter melonis]